MHLHRDHLPLLRPVTKTCATLLATCFLASWAQAAHVTQVKGNQVLIESDESDPKFSEGDKVFLFEDGKKRAIVQIKKVKGKKALAQITKGKASVGALAAGENESGSGVPTKGSRPSENSKSVFSHLTIGFIGGYSIDTQDITTTATSTTAATSFSMTGSGYSFKGFVDVPVAGPLSLLGRAGLEQFNVKGSTTTLPSIKTEILYMSADLLLRVSFTDGSFVPFALAGLGIHFPIAKTSDVLQVSQISPTSVFFGGLGANYAFSSKTYFTLTGEYGYFLPSNEVKTNLIAVRTGIGFRF